MVGVGAPDNPRDVKQNKSLRVVFELYQGSIRKGWRRRRLKEPARVELSDNSNTRADYFNFPLRFLIFSLFVSAKGSANPYSRRLLPPPHKCGGPPPSRMEAWGEVRTKREREKNKFGRTQCPPIRIGLILKFVRKFGKRLDFNLSKRTVGDAGPYKYGG